MESRMSERDHDDQTPPGETRTTVEAAAARRRALEQAQADHPEAFNARGREIDTDDARPEIDGEG
jgi:hypothetical protein